MNQHFDHTAAATGDDQATATGAMMAPPFSADARARFQQVLAAVPANLTYTVNAAPVPAQVTDLIAYLNGIVKTGDTTTYHYVTNIELTGSGISASDVAALKDAISDINTYESATLSNLVAVSLSVAGGAITVTDGALSINQASWLGSRATLSLGGATLTGAGADFFANATTLRADALAALAAHPGAVTVSDGLSLAQIAILTAADAGATINSPITDSIANLAAPSEETQWAFNPAITAGANIHLTDSSVPASLLYRLVSGFNGNVHVTTPDGGQITGTFNDFDYLFLYVYQDQGQIVPSATTRFVDSDPVLDAHNALRFPIYHQGNALDVSNVQKIDGSLADVTSLLSQNSLFHFGGHESVNVNGVTLAQLADARTMVAAHTDGAFGASLSDTAENLVSALATHLFGSSPMADGSLITVTGGALGVSQVHALLQYAAVNLDSAALVGSNADFFSNATTLSANALAALAAHPAAITVGDGLGLAQFAIVAAADPDAAINAPIADTVAHLATYSDNGGWEINPAITAGATVNVTDASVPAGLLTTLQLLAGGSVHVATPNATEIVGTLNDIDNMLGGTINKTTLPASIQFTLTDPLLDASYAVSYHDHNPSLVFNGANVPKIDGSLGDLTTLFGEQSTFNFSGHESVNVRGVTLAQLADARTLVAAHTNGAFTASLEDTVGNLVSQNPTTHVWSANAAIGAGYEVQVSDDNGTYTNMAISAVLALVKAVGVNGHVSATNVDRFTGSAAEVQQLRDSAASIYTYDLTVTDASVTASTLVALRADLGNNHTVATTAGTITGTTTAINTLFFHPNDYTVLSHTVNIVVTSQLRVVDLAGLRASYAEFTSGTVTGTLRDSVQNLTGHLTDSVGGYSVIDSVDVLSAHGTIVAGARHLAVADTIDHLAGHTTAGGATSYTVVDTVANLNDNDGSVTGGAERIIAADTVANLNGHTQDGGASGYTLIDSLSHITAAGDSLLGAAMGIKLTDTMAGVESLAGWGETVFKASVDARGLTLISGHIEPLVDVLENTALTFSGSEAVQVINGGTAAQLNVLDAATTGVVAATVSGTGGELATLTGTGNLYQVTVTDSASVSQLKAIDAATAGNVTYTSVTDTADHLATLKNGVWSANGYVHDGTAVMVLGDISDGELAALDAANGSGDVIVAAPAATDFIVMTSDMHDYIQILATKVFNVIDLEGVQVYEIDAPFAGGHGGILNLSGTDGQNTIQFRGYVPDNVNGAHLTLTQSGTTAIFWDAQTHVEVAAISMSLDHAPIQNLAYEDGSTFNLTLVGTTNPVLTMTSTTIV